MFKMQKYIMWFIASLFLFYDILLRVFPNIFVIELQTRYHIQASTLGQLSAAFMWGYALMQIPAGLLIDRFGIKRTATFGCFIASGGVLIFLLAHYFWLAYISRILMGTGAAFAFLTCMQVIFEQFQPKHKTILVGFTMTIGAAGGIFCNSILNRITNHQNWQAVILGIAIFGFLLTFILPLFLKSHINNAPKDKAKGTLVTNIVCLLKTRTIWLLGLICGCVYLPYAILNDLWGVSFLEITDHFTKTQAGDVISGVWLGWIIGSPIIGYLASRFGTFKTLRTSTFLQLAVLGLILYVPFIHWHFIVFGLGFLLGFLASAMALCYILGAKTVKPALQNTSAAFINTVVTLIVLPTLPFVGKTLDMMARVQGIHPTVIIDYSVFDFKVGLSILFVALLIALCALRGYQLRIKRR